MEWHSWGDSRLGYHLVSLALHLLSALLFWQLLRRLFALGGGQQGGGRREGRQERWEERSDPGSGVSSSRFIRSRVESVAWISELKNPLSLPFLL